jgi:hypothetical protein
MPSSVSAQQSNGRGSGGKNVNFQIALTLYLSILICSNRFQYAILKVLLK